MSLVENLRESANHIVGTATPDQTDWLELVDELRAAADQLEAVAALHVCDANPFEPLADITCQECGQFWPCDTYIAVTANTASQADRDGCGVVTEDPVPTYCTKLHGHDGDHNTEGAV